MTRTLAFLLLPLLLLGSRAAAQAPLPRHATVLSIGGHGDVSDVPLTDLWIARMAETRARRLSLDRWGAPLLLGGAALIGAASAALPDLADETRIVFAGSALLAAGAMVPAILAAPPHKARWLAAGGAAFAAAFGAAGVAQSLSLDNCSGWCGNEKAVGWLGGALFSQAVVLFPLAFVDPGPSLEQLEAYSALPAAERAVVGRKLLARIDRAERKATAIALALGFVGTAVFAAGAVTVRDEDERVPLLALGGATLASTTISTMVGLLRKSRLERLSLGERPGSTERVLW